MKYLILSIGILLSSICGVVNDANASSYLVEQIQKESDFEKAEAEGHLKLVFSAIKSALKDGQEVKIRNFGTFYLQKRKARTGINPKTQEQIEIPARNYPKFRASKNFKELVRN